MGTPEADAARVKSVSAGSVVAGDASTGGVGVGVRVEDVEVACCSAGYLGAVGFSGPQVLELVQIDVTGSTVVTEERGIGWVLTSDGVAVQLRGDPQQLAR